MRVTGEGPIPSRLMLVGDIPGRDDDRTGAPFSGAPGIELSRMLHEAGIMRSECYATTVVKTRPYDGQLSAYIAKAKKDITPAHTLLRNLYCTKEVHEGVAELKNEIAMVEPNLIIVFGNLALWALTGHWSVLKWRGSQMLADTQEVNPPKVIPTLHPSTILRQWDLRAIALSDLRRAKRHMVSPVYDNIPQWNFKIRPTFEEVVSVLSLLQWQAENHGPLWLEFDLETFITTKHIRCAGIGWSRTEAICIPFTDGHENYWATPDIEGEVVWRLYKLLTHPNVKVRGQNLLFDCQYTHRYWHFIPNVAHDTMISQHSCFAALPKGLDFLASMYCDYYQYWKEDK